MTIRDMKTEDIDSVLPLFISYYNELEDATWTRETAGRRLRQLLGTPDSSGVLAEEEGVPLGFAIGHDRQFARDIGFILEEIMVTEGRQDQGIGSAMLRALERAARERGAVCIELQSTNDERHERFYTAAGFRDSNERISKVKWLKPED